MKTTLITISAALFALITSCKPGGAASNQASGEATSVASAEAKPYPLETCLVSGEKLGSMGKPASTVYQGQEIKFCCSHCIPDFEKEPAKFLAKLQAAGTSH